MEMKWLMTSALTQLFGHMNTSDNRDVSGSCGNKIRVAKKEDYPYGFQVPLHYPKYSKADYETMEEVRLDLLLKEYGLSFEGSLHEKRAFAMGSFLWPDQF